MLCCLSIVKTLNPFYIQSAQFTIPCPFPGLLAKLYTIHPWITHTCTVMNTIISTFLHTMLTLILPPLITYYVTYTCFNSYSPQFMTRYFQVSPSSQLLTNMDLNVCFTVFRFCRLQLLTIIKPTLCFTVFKLSWYKSTLAGIVVKYSANEKQYYSAYNQW